MLLLIRDAATNPYVEHLLVDCIERSLAYEVVAVKLECRMGMAFIELSCGVTGDQILEQFSGITDVVLEPWWHSRALAVAFVKKQGSTWLELTVI